MAKNTTTHYSFNDTPGLVRSTKSPITGTQVSIWYTPESKHKTNEERPFLVECVDHGKSKAVVTRVEAGDARRDPRSFCVTCKAASKRTPAKAPAKATPKKATAKKAAPAKKATKATAKRAA